MEQMMNYVTNRQKMGNLGELYVVKRLVYLGFIVEQSQNQHDSKKDGICNGHLFEVKSGSLFVQKHAFGVGIDQLPKLRGVKWIYLVITRLHVKWKNRPDIYVYPEIGNVYRVRPDFKCNPNPFNDKQVIIPLNQPAVELYFKLTQEEIDEISQYAS